MKSQIENPKGLHKRYVIRKLVKVRSILEPNYRAARIKEISTDVLNKEPEYKLIEVEVDKDAEYFVLRLDLGGSDIDHVNACRIAIHAYASAIKSTIPQLAKDLLEQYPLI